MNTNHDDRAQTLHDFAIGMTVFLLVVGYVFTFVPGLFAPFQPETDSTAIRVDRTADFLTEDLLAADSGPRLNASCTRLFFDVGSGSYNCSLLSQPATSNEIGDLAALPTTTTVNVTLVRDDSIATENSDQFAVGPDPESASGRVIRAVRVVSFEGLDYQFVVKIW